jgi:hypothetical protein
MSELIDLKRHAIRLGLCDKYKNIWDACRTKEELINMALDVNGIEFIADGYAYGWGLSTDYITDNFIEFVNGDYLSRYDGYTTEMYVSKELNLIPRATATLIMDCSGDIEIPENKICSIYLAKSNIRLRCKGKCDLYIFNTEETKCEISSEYTKNVRITEKRKMEWNEIRLKD